MFHFTVACVFNKNATDVAAYGLEIARWGEVKNKYMSTKKINKMTVYW